MNELSILIADDQVDLARTYANQFRRSGWRAETATNPTEAVSRAVEKDFSVVLLDMKFPGIEDGFMALEQIVVAKPEQCVVFFTGYGDVDSSVRALQNGADSMVLKDGVKFETLREIVHKAATRRQEVVRIRQERDRAIQEQHRKELDHELDRKRDELDRKNSIIRLAGGSAHTIKNRIASLVTRFDLIAVADNIEEIREQTYLGRIAIDRAFQVVKHLQHIAGLSEVKQCSVDLAELVKKVHENVQRELSGGIDAQIVFSSDVRSFPTVFAPLEYLQDAIENIFLNSVDALVSNGGTIEFRIDSHGDFAVIRISDTGPGFSPEMLQQAHLPFKSTKQDAHFGYGLALVEEVAKLCGGTFKYGNRDDTSGAWNLLKIPLHSSKGEIHGQQ